MVTEATVEPQVLEAQVAELPVAEATTEAPPEPEIDYKTEHGQLTAKVQELEEQAQRSEHQRKTTDGVLRQRLDIESVLGRVYRRLDVQNQMLQALAKGQATGDVETLPNSLAAIEGQYQQQEAQDSIGAEVLGLERELFEEAADAGLDLATAPEFAAARALWNQGVFAQNGVPHPTRRDMKALRAALSDAKRVRREAQTVALAAKVKDVEEKANERLRKSGVVSTPVPSAAGRGPSGNEELWKAYGRGDVPWSPAVEKAGRTLGAL